MVAGAGFVELLVFVGHLRLSRKRGGERECESDCENLAFGYGDRRVQDDLHEIAESRFEMGKTKSINLGINFSVLHSKVNGSFEYYYKKTEDLDYPTGDSLRERGAFYVREWR